MPEQKTISGVTAKVIDELKHLIHRLEHEDGLQANKIEAINMAVPPAYRETIGQIVRVQLWLSKEKPKA